MKLNKLREPSLYKTSISVLSLAIMAALSTGVQAKDYKDIKAADKVNGRSIVEFVSSECGGCHNPKLTGATGPNITKKRLHDGDKSKKAGRFTYPLSAEVVYATVSAGRPGTSMPTWSSDANPIGKALSEEEIKAIAEHVYNVDPPKDFTWTIDQMKKSLQDVPKQEGVKAPAHPDDLLFVTERENFSVGVIDTDTQEVVAHLPAGCSCAWLYL